MCGKQASSTSRWVKMSCATHVPVSCGQSALNCWQAGLLRPPVEPVLLQPASLARPRLSVLTRGIGLRAHVEPGGPKVVPTPETKTPFSSPSTVMREPLFQSNLCAALMKSSGISWKHASVSGLSAGHRRYW